MSKLTQGTYIYFIDPADESVVQVKQATNFNPGGAPADQIDTTPLEANDREYRRGLRTPGQASLTINADPNEPSHIRLHELSNDDTVDKFKLVVGWSDGTAPPTVAAGELELPDTRTWCDLDVYVADFPFDFSSNQVVKTEVSLQRTGKLNWTKKVPV
ncbi:phage tail tube protein [Marinobacter sp. 1Y8]